MNEQAFYRVSVKGIAIDPDGRILLARESDGKWEILGGGLDHGEDPRTCLIREIQEETGLRVTEVSERPLYFITAPSANFKFQTANVIYEIKLENLDFTPSDECQELRYVSAGEMESLELFPNVEKLRLMLSVGKQ